MNNYRHGDLALIGIKELPKGLTETKTKILMTGSNNNPHTFDNGKVYLKKVNVFIFGYFVADNNTKLYHKEHGCKVPANTLLTAKIKKGVYELRGQIENTNEGMKPVIDWKGKYYE